MDIRENVCCCCCSNKSCTSRKTWCFFPLHGDWSELRRCCAGSTGMTSPLSLCSSSQKLRDIATTLYPTHTTETWCFNPHDAWTSSPVATVRSFFLFFYSLEELETVALFIRQFDWITWFCDGAGGLDQNPTCPSGPSSFSWKRLPELIQSWQAFSSKARHQWAEAASVPVCGLTHTHTPSLPLQRQRERGWKKICEEKESLRGSCEGEREREMLREGSHFALCSSSWLLLDATFLHADSCLARRAGLRTVTAPLHRKASSSQ